MPTFERQPRPSFGESLLRAEIPSDLSFKQPIIIRILRTLQERGCLSREALEQVELCLDEAVKNAMTHGNQLNSARNVRFHLFADDARWGLVVEDEGSGMKPNLVPKPIVGEDELRESGYGVILMDSILDELVYMGRGNQLLMVRQRPEVAARSAAVVDVAVPTEEEVEQTKYVQPASARGDVPDLIEFDASEAADAAPVPVPAPPPPAPAAIVPGAQIESESPVLRVHRAQGVRVLEVLEKRISDHNLDAVRNQLTAAAEGEDVVILHLGNVNYISSVVIRTLVALYRQFRERNASLRLCALDKTLQGIFKTTQLDRILPLFPDVGAALKARRS